MLYIPPLKKCVVHPSIVLEENDYSVAKSSKGRLDKVLPVPSCLDECNNIQKRIILYYKIFCFVWTDVYTRVEISICIAVTVRGLFPDDIENVQDDIDTIFYKN